jgi:hydrocephalus-inducing protein
MQLHWNKDHKLQHEVVLANNLDIQLSIIEPATDKPEQLVPLKLHARAQFSKYAIMPARGIHFGPLTYNTTSKPRSFEVCNLGEFPFTLKVFSMSVPEAAPATTGVNIQGNKSIKEKAGESLTSAPVT